MKALWAEKICLTLVRWYEEDGKFLHPSPTPSCNTHKFLTMPRACWCPTEDQEAKNPGLDQTQAGSLLWGSAAFRRGTSLCPYSRAFTAEQVKQRRLAIGKVLPDTLSEGATFPEPGKADWVLGRRAWHIIALTRVGSDFCGFTTSRLRGEQTHTYLMQIC